MQEVVERGGGQALLGRMYDQLITVLEERPGAIIIPSADGATQQTYQALTASLSTMR